MTPFQVWVDDTVIELGGIAPSIHEASQVSEHSLTGKVAWLRVKRNLQHVVSEPPVSMRSSKLGTANLYTFDQKLRKRG